MLNELFKSCCESIDVEYLRLGHQLGWRFITGPKETFSSATRIAFISLNPGGDCDPPDHPHESSERGSSYLVESWKRKPPGTESLQVQFQQLMSRLRQGCSSDKSLIEFINTEVLSAHFIPFRSPRFDSLHNKVLSVAFGRKLWAGILQSFTPSIIITLNPETFHHLSEILQYSGHELVESREFQTGWGIGTSRPIGCEARRYSHNSATTTILRLPHLSTFKLFSNDKCVPYLDAIFDYVCNSAGKSYAKTGEIAHEVIEAVTLVAEGRARIDAKGVSDSAKLRSRFTERLLASQTTTVGDKDIMGNKIWDAIGVIDPKEALSWQQDRQRWYPKSEDFKYRVLREPEWTGNTRGNGISNRREFWLRLKQHSSRNSYLDAVRNELGLTQGVKIDTGNPTPFTPMGVLTHVIKIGCVKKEKT